MKPENVLIDKDGYAKITDFGLSKIMNKSEDKTFSFCGTPEYLAPEIIEKQGYSVECDWWSLGAFIYELVTGKPPFMNESNYLLYKMILTEEIDIPKYLSLSLQDLLHKLLCKDPSKRLGTKSIEEIKNHEWFKSVNWEEMFMKKLEPPMKPIVGGITDTRNFDDEYTTQDKDQNEIEEQNDDSCDGIWKGFEYQEEESLY